MPRSPKIDLIRRIVIPEHSSKLPFLKFFRLMGMIGLENNFFSVKVKKKNPYFR